MKSLIILLFINLFNFCNQSFTAEKSISNSEFSEKTSCRPKISENTSSSCPTTNYPTYSIQGTIYPEECGGTTIKKFKVRYRNITDNKSWNSSTHDYKGIWYVQGLTPNKQYEIKVFYKFGTDIFRFAGQVTAWSGCNTTHFTLNGSQAKTIDICGNERITMDGSASKDEVGYSIALRELNANNQAIGREMFKSFNGAVPNNINIRSVAQSNNFVLEGGKKYYLKLVTKPVWREKVIYLNFLPAKVNFEPNATREQGFSDRYTRCVDRNNNFNLQLKTTSSTCETQYFVEISEVDASFNNIPSTTYSGWITPLRELPDVLDIKSIYYNNGHSFQLNKYYRVKVAVGMPWHEKTIFVKFTPANVCHYEREKDKLNHGFN